MKVTITREPIEPSAVLSAVGGPEDGAAVLFLGTVRNHNDGRAVRGMRYDAYVEMAEGVLAEIVAEAVARWGLDRGSAPRVAAVHRIGELAIGEVSVAIAVATPHRAEAFEACRYVIEEIKRRLPVWKEEAYVDGTAEWLDGETPPTPEAARE